jgi:trk system potassium uptake protein TrkH
MRLPAFRVNEDLRIILRNLGLVVPTVGLMAALSLPVAAAFGEEYALWPLAETALVAFGLGAALYLPFRGAGETRLKHGLLVAAVGWLLVAAVGALPFFLMSSHFSGGTSYPFMDMTNAFFESVSGFTTTGLTMSLRPDLLPHTLQWWRSFTQWIGGIGVIVLMLTLIAGPRASTLSLYFAEARGEKIHPSIISTIRTMWWIYLLYTLSGTVLLWGAGMQIWPSLNHSMTALSTGGFSLSPHSIAGYSSLAIELAIIPLILLGAINFAVHYSMMHEGGVRALWRNYQTRGLIVLILVWCFFLFLENLATMPVENSARLSFFQAISAATTTGYQTADIHSWTDTAKLILAAAMFVGATAGSTAGGVKVMRAVLLIRGVSWHLRRTISAPSAVLPFRLGDRVLSDEEASHQLQSAAMITFLWAGFLGLGILVLLHTVPEGFSLSDVIFEVASAQGTVGLSVGITHPEMATLSKLVLCFNMWIGRLEIIPVLMLVRFLFFGVQ